MKNKILLIIFVSQLFNCFTSYAQIFNVFGDRAFGTNKTDYVPSVINTGNGRFVIAGYSNGNLNGDKTEPLCDSIYTDIWLVKIDTGFNIIWNRSIGGNKNEYLPYLAQTKNSSRLIISCYSNADSSCEKSSNNRSYPVNSYDYWISTLDSNGNQIYDQTLGGTGVERSPQTIELSSGNFITCGTSSSPVSGDKTAPNHLDTFGMGTFDYWVVKTDSTGNKLWDKVYGGTGIEWDGTTTFNDFRLSVLAEPDDNFIIAGSTSSPADGDVSDTSRGLHDIWIIKIDSAGNKIWDKRYGGSGFDDCTHISQTNDNGYILCGRSNSSQSGDVSDSSKGAYDCWVIKLDSLGNKQWDRLYGGDKIDYPSWIEQEPGGGYWISGTTYSGVNGDITEPKYCLNSSDIWIFKIDDAGNKLCDKRFGSVNPSTGGPFIIMPDSSIYLFAQAGAGMSAVKTDSGRGGYDYWVVHFKYIDTTCVISVTINPTACNSYISPSGNYNWSATGIYNDTIPNGTGCDSVITINLTINNSTTSSLTIVACDNYTSPSGNYAWGASGIYLDTIANSSGCDSIIIINLTIDTVDTSVTQTGNTLTANLGSAAYQWLDCDNGFSIISGATSQVFNPTSVGNYAVVIALNGCADTSLCYAVTGVGINETGAIQSFIISPNPVTDLLTVSLNKPLSTGIVITINDIQGRAIKEEKISHSNSSVIPINVSSLSQGVYLLKLNGRVQRFVKM